MSTSDDSTRPISVAELLAKNGTIGAPPPSAHRRRRRVGGVTVAELTGEIPVYQTGEMPVVRDADEGAPVDLEAGAETYVEYAPAQDAEYTEYTEYTRAEAGAEAGAGTVTYLEPDPGYAEYTSHQSAPEYTSPEYSGSNYSGSDYSGSDYSGSDYSGSDYSGSDYSGSDYSGSDYTGSDYTGSDYSGYTDTTVVYAGEPVPEVTQTETYADTYSETYSETYAKTYAETYAETTVEPATGVYEYAAQEYAGQEYAGQEYAAQEYAGQEYAEQGETGEYAYQEAAPEVGYETVAETAVADDTAGDVSGLVYEDGYQESAVAAPTYAPEPAEVPQVEVVLPPKKEPSRPAAHPKSRNPLPRRVRGLQRSHDPRPQRQTSAPARRAEPARASGAEQMNYDPVDSAVSLSGVGTASSGVEELRTYLQSSGGTLFSGETVADDLARRVAVGVVDPAGEAPVRTAGKAKPGKAPVKAPAKAAKPAKGAKPKTAQTAKASKSQIKVQRPRESRMTAFRHAVVAVLQSMLAVVFGGGLFIAFDRLWQWNNIVALVLSVLVILGLVVGVRVVRRTEDIASTLIAVVVGALVTLGPLALLQTS